MLADGARLLAELSNPLDLQPQIYHKMNIVRVPNDIADFFGVPEFLTREELCKFFPSVAISDDGKSADWSAYADVFQAYEGMRVSANRLALVLAHYRDEQTRIHCAQPFVW